jgi:hypothetical protein
MVVVKSTLTAQPALLEETSASYISAQDLRNAGAKYHNENPNGRGQRLATNISWQTQRDEAEHWLLKNSYLAKKFTHHQRMR